MGDETKTQPGADQIINPDSGLEYRGAYRLDNEWQLVIEELRKTDQGRKALEDPEFREFYWESSWKMQCIDHAVEQGLITPENISPTDARTMYYSYPSLISMEGRSSTLEVIAEVGEKEIAQLYRREPITYLLRCRRLASIYEELSSVSDSDKSTAYLDRATELNLTISESSLYLPASPRKLHAGFAVYDAYFRNKREHLSQEDFSFAQFGYHKDLASALRETRLGNIDAEGISGSVGEVLVLGRLRGIAYEEGRLDELDISQSYIRQDSSQTQSYAHPSWKWAFDLKIDNFETKKTTPIEVKKRTVGSKISSDIGNYLPIVNVIMFRLGRSKKEYMHIAENYCEGMAKIYSGEAPGIEQLKAIRDFHSKVDDPLRHLVINA